MTALDILRRHPYSLITSLEFLVIRRHPKYRIKLPSPLENMYFLHLLFVLNNLFISFRYIRVSLFVKILIVRTKPKLDYSTLGLVPFIYR